MAILRVTIGCFIGIFMMSTMVLSETIEEKIELYNALQQAISNPNYIWLPMRLEDDDIDDIEFMTKQQLDQKIRTALYESGTYTHGKHSQMMDYNIKLSQITKSQIQSDFLPTLRSEIDSLTTYSNNNSPSNTSSFGSVLSDISSTEHLDALAFQSQNNDQCPDWNPGNKARNRFDSNNNPNDQTFVNCDYFKDGKLSYQVPFVDGKKHGEVLKYRGSPPYPLAEATNYRNGKKNGSSEMWLLNSKSGHSYRTQKSEYTNGKLHGEQVQYHENGVIKRTVVYNSNGKPITNCSYDKSGKQISCTNY